ncbi:MAG: LysR family transcriptional regulator [Alphaproteobacteria bacterium]
MSLHLLPRPLRYVEAVAEHGSIQAASRALGIAASAIDRHIRSLEEASQAPLFERLPRGMRPTAAGEAVIVLARRWRADAERLDSGLREMRGQERGTVRIAAMDSLANGILPELVHWLQEEHPRLHLAVNVVTPAEASRELDDGTVDLVVAFNLPQQRHQHRLWIEQLPFGCALAPSHPLASASEITLRMLSRHATVSQSVLLPIRQYLDSRYGWLFTENEPVLATNSLQLLKQSLRRGSLAMITSALDVLPEIEAGDLVFIPLRERGLKPQTIAVAIDSRRPMQRAARVVADHLAEHMDARLRGLRS